jgi:hypothetical protein
MATNEKRDAELPQRFDGDKFPVWKYYMEIWFDDRDVLPVVDGTIPKPPDDAPDAEKLAWQKANKTARRLISSSVSLPVLESLVNCPTAASMWSSLCAFYQQKSKENILLV